LAPDGGFLGALPFHELKVLDVGCGGGILTEAIKNLESVNFCIHIWILIATILNWA